MTLIPRKTILWNEDKIKTVQSKEKLRECVGSRINLQDILEGVLSDESKWT